MACLVVVGLAYVMAMVLPASAGQTFICDIDSYDGSVAHLDKIARPKNYEMSFGIFNFGTKEAHARMRAAAKVLEIDANRTPIIYGDFDSRKLYILYCPGEVCTMEDLARGQQDCAATLQSKQCFPFAIRLGRDLYCVAGPTLSSNY